ncbi:L-asparaginase II [Paenibacillus shirakamiensis]|uniref:L-asparaginase II n=1 Tax=Paenibacillus shirakamiensis TaxID=1265935 RepID=A0ABS4JPB1_9BACL|nr:asparaginase [Paenibacillus shirakamiensis]MBP2002469.1 L-asparaginase II [Paenibacillus shirakamiensis]
MLEQLENQVAPEMMIKEYRGNWMENAHYGHISIVNEYGEVVYALGDPHYRAFTRSSAKPLQAIPGIRAGIHEHYGLSTKEVAVMTASHRSEEVHVQTLEHLSEKVEIGEHCLVCAPSLPLDEGSKEDWLRAGGGRRRLYHNCSGKHLGVLAYSKMMGYSLQGYDQPDHPAQQEIIETFATMTGMSTDDLIQGTDGCGFPVFALPLSNLAYGYVKLACPDLIQDEATRVAVETITSAMNTYPILVGGSDRVDSLLLKDQNIIAKGGFKGVYCFSLKKERLGIAFKILDGSEEEWGWVVQSILEQIGYDVSDTIHHLKENFSKKITNDVGTQVGYAEGVFHLKSSLS